MNMWPNALLVLLALVMLVLKNSSAETSVASAVSSTRTTSSTGTVSTTSTVSSTSTTGKAASTRSATEELKEWGECKKRQCDGMTCAECRPENEVCESMCKQTCMCACGGYKRVGMDVELWGKCQNERCMAKYLSCTLRCRGNEKQDECQSKCELDLNKCSCECQQVTRAQAREAVVITAATSCSTAEETMEEWDRCNSKCEDAREAFSTECGNEGEGEDCLNVRLGKCTCGCAGLPSGKHYAPLNGPYMRSCVSKFETNKATCLSEFMSMEIGGQNWCHVYFFKGLCECRDGAASGTDAAEDRTKLELCTFTRSCPNATCECLEADAECVFQCRDSCRCGCLSFPADGPGVQPAGGRLTVTQCRDKRDACKESCSIGDSACKDRCFLEQEMCNCKCAGRSSPPSPTKKKTLMIPSDTGDKPIVQHCNYIN